MNVRVYTTPTCPYCRMLKDFLVRNKISFEEINVAADYRATMEMVRKSGQAGVPVTEIDGVIIVGFNVDALKKALNLK